MKKQITRISPHQSSKVIALIYFIFMLLFMPFGVIMFIAGSKEKWMGLFFIFAPVIYGILAYLMFGLFILAYNFVAKRFGGVEFIVTETSE